MDERNSRLCAHSSTILALFIAGASIPSWSCGGDEPTPTPACDLPLDFEVGDDGLPDPLGTVGPGAARAGRVAAADLPATPEGLAVWAEGDFVLANDRVAMIIEDVGPSDLYDPWGGRPVGIMSVLDGELVAPASFGEFFILTGRQTVMTESVSVIADGSDGGPAIVRATGRTLALPFYESLVGVLLRDDYSDIPIAIDYVLEPDAEHVDIYLTYNSPRLDDTRVGVVLHAHMYTKRVQLFAPELGFDAGGSDLTQLAFIEDQATSYAYSVPGQEMSTGLSASGFFSNFAEPFNIPACIQTQRHYARIDIGGPGLDGLIRAQAREQGVELRAITGVVRFDNGLPAAGVRVHATDVSGGYLTRATSDETGAFTVHVPMDRAVELTTFKRGQEALGPMPLGPLDDNIELVVPTPGDIRVTAVDEASGLPLPVRIQVLPVDRELPSVPESFGEPRITGGRLHVEYAMDGQALMSAPTGQWEVVVSRGYEYELYREIVEVVAGQTVEVQARLEHVVDTTGYMCADYHIHTNRSPDSGDDARLKLMSGVADGLELPIRSEHEYVDDFQPLIEELGLGGWAFGVGSVELTTFQLWGHMGVFPLEPDDSLPNRGAPAWQRFPSASDPERPIETLFPPEVFGQVRARPEQPVIIINHPRRSTNYFDISGYDPMTGEVDRPEYWDEEFQLVEFFNSSSWQEERQDLVLDWLGLLQQGRRVFAVGSSDSHTISSTPLGYPRTCLNLGTDDPRALTPDLVRDVTAGGHSTISGGIFVFADVAGAGPGEDATGLPAESAVHVRLEAPSWVDVDWLEIVVDGQTVDQIAVQPSDADINNPAIRFERDITIPVASGLGSYVIVAAYGETDLAPVHPGREAFGVSNPIFLSR